MDKLFLFRTLIMAVMICLLAWDSVLWMIRQTPLWPHRDLLLTGALLWIVTLFFPQNSDDDWAGQF